MSIRKNLTQCAASLLIVYSPMVLSNPIAKPGTPAPVATAPVTQSKFGSAVTVNGISVPQYRVDSLVAEQVSRGAQDSANLRESIKEELIRREMLLQEAKKIGLDRQPFPKARAEVAYHNVLVSAFLQDWLRDHPILDNEVKKEYDQWVSKMGNTEYLIRHILVGSDEEAKGVIARLKADEKFENIAAKQSRDAGSRNKGGQLDWTGAGALEKSMADVVTRLAKGKTHMEPVQTSFGWHVLQLEDSRPFKAPPFDQVKAQIKQNLEQQSIGKYVNDLRKVTKVE